MSVMRCSPAATASNVWGQVGERFGNERKLSTGSRSVDADVGEWKVSAFLREPGDGGSCWGPEDESAATGEGGTLFGPRRS